MGPAERPPMTLEVHVRILQMALIALTVSGCSWFKKAEVKEAKTAILAPAAVEQPDQAQEEPDQEDDERDEEPAPDTGTATAD